MNNKRLLIWPVSELSKREQLFQTGSMLSMTLRSNLSARFVFNLVPSDTGFAAHVLLNIGRPVVICRHV